jgi:hypothetical protein
MDDKFVIPRLLKVALLLLVTSPVYRSDAANVETSAPAKVSSTASTQATAFNPNEIRKDVGHLASPMRSGASARTTKSFEETA